MKGLVKSVATITVIVLSTASTFAATTTASDTSNGLATEGGVALLIAAIILPTFKSSK
jgi:hypothetical protein